MSTRLTRSQAREAIAPVQNMIGQKATIIYMGAYCNSIHCTIEGIKIVDSSFDSYVIIIQYKQKGKRTIKPLQVYNHSSTAIYEGHQLPNTTTNEKLMKTNDDIKMVDMGMAYDKKNFTGAIASLEITPIFLHEGIEL